MNTFLFAWNPVKWPWPEIGECVALLKSGKKVTESWNCVSHKKVKPGDRAFFSKVGTEPRGIFASGYVRSEPFLSKGRKGTDIYCVIVEFDVLLDPATTPILTLDILKIGKLERQLWTPQSSGIIIKPEFAEELEMVWGDFLER
jgi:5-methylcytosine-specific restriction enzyme A